MFDAMGDASREIGRPDQRGHDLSVASEPVRGQAMSRRMRNRRAQARAAAMSVRRPIRVIGRVQGTVRRAVVDFSRAAP